jgi:hypothetical protein
MQADALPTDGAGTPVFHSALARAIEMGRGAPRCASASGWRGWLDGAQRRGALRAAERAWIGVDAWLDAQPGPVTREQLAGFARANEIRVEEVTLSDADRKAASRARGLYRQMQFQEDKVRGLRHQSTDAMYGASCRAEAAARLPETEKELARLTDAYRVANEAARAAIENVTPTRFDGHRTPGGEHYRELLLTVPNPADRLDARRWEIEALGHAATQAQRGEWVEIMNRIRPDGRDVEGGPRFHGMPDYRSPHWGPPNVVVHVRFDERTEGGRRVLFLQEIQSDWAQEGRKRGYRSDDAWALRTPYGFTLDARYASEDDATDAIQGRDVRAVKVPRESAVPDTPFKTTEAWVLLAMKRMVRWAVDEGFDAVAWIAGDQAVAVNNLSRQVDAIAYVPHRDGTFDLEVVRGGRYLDAGRNVQASRLPDIVGKKVAARIVNSEGAPQRGDGRVGERVLRGDDLEIGGEGLRSFYDRIVPAAVGRWARPFGGRVQTAVLDGADGMTVHRLAITPAMRLHAIAGMPLFRRDGGGRDAPVAQTETPAFRAWFGDSVVVDPDVVDPDAPLVVYHGTTASFDRFASRSPRRIVYVDGVEVACAYAFDMGEDGTGAPEAYHYMALGDVEHHGAEAGLAFRTAEARRTSGGEAYPDTARMLRDLRRLSGRDVQVRTEERATGAGFYFTPDPSYSFIRDIGTHEGGNVMPVYVSIRNPVFLNASQIEGAGHPDTIAALKAQGYDGAIFAEDPGDLRRRGVGGATQILVFDATQIKSAIANRGTFDPNDPNVMHRRDDSGDVVAAAICATYASAAFWDIVVEQSEARAGPFDGACLICAKAIIRAADRGQLVRITYGGQAEHYGAEIDGAIYDFEGRHDSPAAWIEAFATVAGVGRTWGFARGLGQAGEIPDDPRAEKAVARLLEKSMRPAPRPAHRVNTGAQASSRVPSSGVSVAEAEAIVHAFVSRYRGHCPLDIAIAARQEDAYGPTATIEERGRLKGGYFASRQLLVIAAASHTDADDVRRTLRHEVLGHFGLDTLAPNDKRAVLEKLVAARDAPGLKALWDEVERCHRPRNGEVPRGPLKMAEEVFALAAEQPEPGRLGAAWLAVLAAFTRGLRRIRLVTDAITLVEVQAMAATVAGQIRAGSAVAHTMPTHATEEPAGPVGAARGPAHA